MKKQILDGNGAAAEAIRASNVEVVAMYPITPQSPLAEKLSLLIAKGEMDSTCTCVESEHSAISYVIGSQLTGVRSTTATSSVGLALMHEVLGVAAGCHVPIVMPVVNRALVSPWSLWCDHQDTMCERDTGWMQIYAENAQEIYDLILCSYRVAEHRDVCLPMMVCMDGFYVSHTLQTVITEDNEAVSGFVGRYVPTNLVLDNSKPMFINNLTSPDEYTEMRYQQKISFDNAREVMADVFSEFKEKFGREYSLTEAYCCEDAEAVLVCLGSACGTIKHMIQVMRKEGYKVGLLKIISYRPFPAEEVRSALNGIKKIGVVDRSSGLGGNFGPLGLDVSQAVNSDGSVNFVNFVTGLGGRDVSEDTIRKMFMALLNNEAENQQVWIDVHDDALEIREKGERQEGRA
ncbi:pyruvate ferredoxin oxidoreductase [Ruminococcus flavefaciens]|uniref:pyruvate ferredoxin oxidoreductase n=1 Tax=Ruminococcus flavefaciens TaxID=1265 RepID=UPI000464BCDE|nr:pyruvate ferredoxin oxidoreductase [Ruminococcus flavefaciens]